MLDAAKLVGQMRRAGFVLECVGEQIRITPSSRLSESQRAALRENKAAVVELLKPRTWAKDLTFRDAKAAIIAALDAMPERERARLIDRLNRCSTDESNRILSELI